MQILKQSFSDFNLYNESVIGWNLEYNILSQRDFKAKVNMFLDEDFSLVRVSLDGKLVHSGQTPVGYRSFVVPIKYNDRFIWFDKGIGGNELLVFPKNYELNAVTFNNFDVFVVSIKSELLEKKYKEIDCIKCDKLFANSERELFLSKEFAKEFYEMANFFLTKHIKSEDVSEIDIDIHKILVNNIIDRLLNYINKAKIITIESRKSKKQQALKEVVRLIETNVDSLYTIKDLSQLTNVSERTILYAFKEKYNVTPSDYIKAYRLNKVKSELFALKGQNIKISDVAGKYNFWHMGQFAKDFKKHFGILPSEV